jgi:transcriptional regulator with XRE-family HTH domain
MATVGERLRLVRESRNTSIEDMVVATGIGQSYLEAVERDEIHELPGKAFGKLYIRAYAEVFGFDPQPWIDDYDREQRLAAGASTEPASPVPAGARPVAAAIARWRESRAAEGRSEAVVEEAPSVEIIEEEAVVEDEPLVEVEPVVENTAIVETVAPDPELPHYAPVVTPEIAARAAPIVPKAKRPIARFALAGVVAIAAALYFTMRGTGGDGPAVQRSQRQSVVQPKPEPPPPASPPPTIVEPPKAAAAKPAVVQETPAGSLTVTESGVGLRIVNSRLEGERTEFVAGQVACFQTRVLGGTRGDSIRHVWIYDGRAQQSITLRLGGPDWRTHTNKTLYKTGPWSVEARDRYGRVLASASFACVPATNRP